MIINQCKKIKISSSASEEQKNVSSSLYKYKTMKVFEVISEAPTCPPGYIMSPAGICVPEPRPTPSPAPDPNDKGLKLDPDQKRYKEGLKEGHKKWRFDNKKGIVVYNEKGIAKSYRPSELIKEIGGTALQAHNSRLGKVLEKALSNPFVQTLQLLTAAYVIYSDWIEDITAINVGLEAGYFNHLGDKATSEATTARTFYTHLAISKILTILPTALLAVKTSASFFRLVRACLLGLPGAGWIAFLATEAALAAIFYLLDLESVQFWFVENWFNAAYPLAELGGGATWKIGTGKSAANPANKDAADAKSKVAPNAPEAPPKQKPKDTMTSQDAAKAIGAN